MLYNILIYPIELLIEILFVMSFKAFDNVGLSIVVISVLVSFLTLPLYRRAEAVQQKERDQRVALQPGIDRIKQVFHGDEQYMMLSTFYKQNHYHPFFTLRSSVSLLIQVPFFIAAYHFLSHLPLLVNEQLLWIQDLSQQDQLIRVGTIPVNVLPILMTAINIFAGALYSKGFPLRDKIQLYGMAGLFLVLLYRSPAGLVFYWTLNNVFSLIKIIFYKVRKPQVVLYVLGVLASIGLTLSVSAVKPNLLPKYRMVLYASIGIMVTLPLLIKGWRCACDKFLGGLSCQPRQRFVMFVQSSSVLWVLYGMLIPLNTIQSSPIEFSFIEGMTTPLGFVLYTSSVYLGLLVVWPLLLYGIAHDRFKNVFAYGFSAFSIISVINLVFFPGNYGTMSRLLEFDKPQLLAVDRFSLVVPVLICVLILLFVLLMLWRQRHMWVRHIITIALFASLVYSGVSTVKIQNSFKAHSDNLAALGKSGGGEAGANTPVFSLSTTGSNVVILFLDRAINSFLPLIFDEFPQLNDQYGGFVYYPNTVSFGAYTLTGAPAMMGGYEYTPEAIDLRLDEPLVDKHNEASLVLPRMFSDAGFDVSVFDPPYLNYQWSKDFSPFEPYPKMDVQSLVGRYSQRYKVEHEEGGQTWGYGYESRLMKRRMVMFSFFKTALPLLRDLLYMKGTYFLLDESSPVINQFIDSYSTLYYLPQITGVDTHETGHYVFLANDTTHDPVTLQSPEYEPVAHVTDNSNPLQHDLGYGVDEQQHYQTNAAVLKQIGKWLSSLKEQGVYDNTRIIIVSDHGRGITTPAFKDFSEHADLLGYYHPLLLVKDFDATGAVMVDDQFMTNADVPLMAIEGLAVDTRNPFTKISLGSTVQKELVKCYFSDSSPESHGKNQFVYDLNQSFSVHTSIFEENNWEVLK
jgi:YidC/Oxa1 family membrane protein insertase